MVIYKITMRLFKRRKNKKKGTDAVAPAAAESADADAAPVASIFSVTASGSKTTVRALHRQ